MDEIIDNAILRAGGLPFASPDLLSYLTMFTLRSLPRDLAGLGIRRFGGSWKEPRWTIGPLSYWVRRRIGSGLRWPAFFALSRTVTTRQVRRLLLITSTLRACSGLITWPAENPHPSSVKSSIQNTRLQIARRGARGSGARKLTSSPRVERSIASASMLCSNSYTRKGASRKHAGCGAAAFSDRAVVLLLLNQLFFPLLGRIQDVPPHAPIKIISVVGCRRCRGRHSVLVQQVGGPAFRSSKFLSLPELPRTVHLQERPHS